MSMRAGVNAMSLKSFRVMRSDEWYARFKPKKIRSMRFEKHWMCQSESTTREPVPFVTPIEVARIRANFNVN
ncbi:MAG TPA: hypothetical protein VHV30_15170, partial [Polyangiaceae bacterium]|nr:hypothetical protein [Polyangiaceae bacterium]